MMLKVNLTIMNVGMVVKLDINFKTLFVFILLISMLPMKPFFVISGIWHEMHEIWWIKELEFYKKEHLP